MEGSYSIDVILKVNFRNDLENGSINIIINIEAYLQDGYGITNNDVMQMIWHKVNNLDQKNGG